MENKPFRFEAAWLSHPDCEALLQGIWNSNTNIVQAIDQVPDLLIPWNKEQFGNIFHRKKQVLARLGGIQKALTARHNEFLANLENELINDYNTILHQEELFWFQKSRVKWL